MSRRTRQLRRENRRLEKELNLSARHDLDEVMEAVQTPPLTEAQEAEVRGDLIRMALDAEARGETLKQALGEEPLDFCEALIAALPPLTLGERLLRLARSLALFALVGVVCVVVVNILPELWVHTPEGQVRIDLSLLVITLTWGIFTELYRTTVNRRAFRRAPFVTAALWLLPLLLCAGLLVAVQVLLGPWAFVPIPTFGAVSAALLLVWAVLNELVD